MIPHLYTDHTQGMIRLELSPKVPPVFKTKNGFVLEKCPPFANSTHCFCGDAICSIYGFYCYNGNNTLKVRLDTLYLNERTQLTTLPLSLTNIPPTSVTSSMSPDTAQLVQLLLADDANIQGTK